MRRHPRRQIEVLAASWCWRGVEVNANPIPGWYHDPDRPGWLRRWNGSHWVDEWSPAPMAMSPPSPPTPAESPMLRRRKLRPFVIAASLLAGLALVAAGVAVWASSNGPNIDESPTSGSISQSEPNSPSDESSGDDDRVADDGNDAGALIDRCGRSDVLTIPGTDVSIEPISLDQERSIGADTRSLVLAQYQVSDDGDTQSLLDRLLDDVEPPQTGIDFVVTLLESDEVNAFAIPGGDLYFTSGITSLMTEDDLAFVMAHEVGHVVCRHLAQQFERQALVIAGLDALLGSEIDTGRLYAEAAASVLTEVADLGFSRDDEGEADVAALDLLASAGRPLSAGPSALRVLQELEGNLEPSAIDVFFSTHPPTAERIERLEDEISQR